MRIKATTEELTKIMQGHFPENTGQDFAKPSAIACGKRVNEVLYGFNGRQLSGKSVATFRKVIASKCRRKSS